MTPQRKRELIELAQVNLEQMVAAWWYEIGSWDGWLEDELLTMDELNWIWENLGTTEFVELEGE
jgi:hypothetical protein